jgi:hypothetical protein
MPKRSPDAGRDRQPPSTTRPLPQQRDGTGCDSYAPGHLIHYQHQGDAVRSPSLRAHDVRVDGTLVVMHLEDDREVQWRHHDPDRLQRIVELLRGHATAYPDFHALRVGPFWFNCATERDGFRDCRGGQPS